MTDRAPKFMPEPRGFKREQAAHYVGVGPSQFLTDYLREADAEDSAA